MEFVACDYCNGREFTTVARQTDRLHRTTDEVFTIVRCNACGLHFTNPRPAPGEIGRFYAADYSFHLAQPAWKRWFGRMLDRWANSPLAILGAIAPPLGNRLATRVCPRLPDPVTDYYASGGGGGFLDIGCGSGSHAHYWGYGGSLRAYRRLVRAAGVEVSATARQALTDEGIESWPNIESVPADRRFGMIRMNWSLEHVHSPASYFRFIVERLQAGGRALIAVPNYEGAIYRLAPACVELPIHLYHFRLADLEGYAAKYGLRVKDVKCFSYPAMFKVAGDAGLLPEPFAAPLGIVEAKRMARVLALFDRAGWGNDLVVELEMPT